MGNDWVIWITFDFIDRICAEDFDAEGFGPGGFEIGGREVLNCPVNHFFDDGMVWVVVLGLGSFGSAPSTEASGQEEQCGC